MELLDMVKSYQSLLETKEALAAQTKENNAAIEAAKAQIAQQMVDDDCPSIATGGYRFTLQEKTIYSKRSEEALAEAGVNFLDTLREEGLGDIIVERVDSRTLQSTIFFNALVDIRAVQKIKKSHPLSSSFLCKTVIKLLSAAFGFTD